MNNDTKSSLRVVQTASTESLTLRVRDLQTRAKLMEYKQKSAMRLCIQVEMNEHKSPTKGTNPINLWHHDSDEYIAISCPWSLPGYEESSGRYSFTPYQPRGVIMPPDVVLDRILNFKFCNPAYLHTPFWVDKLCINQEASDEKEMAVHSMDLVYQYSGKIVITPGETPEKRTVGCSLGLLFVKIDTVSQLTTLRNLLDGKFAENNNDEPKLLVPVEETGPIFEVIEKILSDNWWHRAWIFQEEFLASRHMILLLPCSIERAGLFDPNEEGVDLFGKTSGEIHVYALNFRTEVTTFCLALSRHADEARRRCCDEILRLARRYTFLYRSKYSAGPSSEVRAMSPAIFEDIRTRGITVPSDILAIAANCCRYTARLNSKVLNDARDSLSIAILALFLINGEILRQDLSRDVILGQNIFECLQTAKLKIKPPLQAAALIFIKNCRFPYVKMTSLGLQVRGVLSRLDKKVKVKISPADQEFYWKHCSVEDLKTLHEAEKRLLRAFASHLSGLRRFGGDALPRLLRAFADEDKGAQYWSPQHIQILMAKAVCRAIAEQRTLWMARGHAQGKWTPWLGAFVCDDGLEQDVASFAFTSSETDHEYTDRGAKLARKNTRVTSLEVGFAPLAETVTPNRWLNGLVFFNGRDHPRNWTVPWPTWMQ